MLDIIAKFSAVPVGRFRRNRRLWRRGRVGVRFGYGARFRFGLAHALHEPPTSGGYALCFRGGFTAIA